MIGRSSTSGPQVVVMGASAGAVETLLSILPALPVTYKLPVIVVVHLPPDRDSTLAGLLNARCPIMVKEAEDKEPILPGRVYLAPPGYHLLVEPEGLLSLSKDEMVHFSRPSIDVLFESAADAYGDALVGIILTGANNDGALGLRAVHESGGLTIVQDPLSASADTMPLSALKACPEAHLMRPEQIAEAMSSVFVSLVS